LEAGECRPVIRSKLPQSRFFAAGYAAIDKIVAAYLRRRTYHSEIGKPDASNNKLDEFSSDLVNEHRLRYPGFDASLAELKEPGADGSLEAA
jgi:hypothetical protein